LNFGFGCSAALRAAAVQLLRGQPAENPITDFLKKLTSGVALSARLAASATEAP
jgi:hypothetical protein